MGKITKIKNVCEKIKISRSKIKAIATVTLALITGVVGFNFKGIFGKNDISAEDLVQQVGINEIYKSDDISILDVGDHQVKGEFDLSKIKKAIRKGNDVGIIISSTADSKSDIYKDIDFVKQIIAKYDIKCGVYLDVTNLINNVNFDASDVLEYVNIFTSKLESNGVFVGIAGSEVDIQALHDVDVMPESDDKYDKDDNKDNLDTKTGILSKSDILFLDSDDELDIENADGINSLIERNDDGDYETTFDFAATIEERHLNEEKAFVADLVYVVQEGDTLKEIAQYYGLSQRDLVEYNGLKSNEIKVGDELVIPSFQHGTGATEKTELSEKIKDEDYVFGVDISVHQGNIDWDKLAPNISYALLRVQTYGNKIDNRFEEYASECAKRNVPFGVYIANYVGHEEIDETDEIEKKKEYLKHLKLIWINPLKNM